MVATRLPERVSAAVPVESSLECDSDERARARERWREIPVSEREKRRDVCSVSSHINRHQFCRQRNTRGSRPYPTSSLFQQKWRRGNGAFAIYTIGYPPLSSPPRAALAFCVLPLTSSLSPFSFRLPHVLRCGGVGTVPRKPQSSKQRKDTIVFIKRFHNWRQAATGWWQFGCQMQRHQRW